MDIAELLTREYLDWQKKVGRRTIKQFSQRLKVPPASLSDWMAGKYPPKSMVNIENIAKELGSEVYDVLGLSRPQSDEDLLAEFPAEWRERFLRARREYTAELAKQGITTDTPEAEQIITDALTRHGINFTLTHGSD